MCFLSRVLPACMAILLLAVPGHADLGDCGQPVTTGAGPAAADALFILRVAIGLETCQTCICDVDFAGAEPDITAADALRTLRRAVGQAVTLTCSPCSVVCESSQAPACGGTCAGMLSCAPSATDPELCTCQSECERSSAPTCGGSCDFLLPTVLECRQVTFSGELGDIATCLCLPPGLEVCVDAQGPDCSGACTPGSECAASGDACVCEDQPLQGTCAEAVAPQCGGTCPADLVCVNQAGSCACLDVASHDETCADAAAPACAGACASGRTCTVGGVFQCECFDPCEISGAPACDGGCSDPGKVCMLVTANIGGSDLTFCECHLPR